MDALVAIRFNELVVRVAGVQLVFVQAGGYVSFKLQDTERFRVQVGEEHVEEASGERVHHTQLSAGALQQLFGAGIVGDVGEVREYRALFRCGVALLRFVPH